MGQNSTGVDTYHSIDVISQAQHKHALPDFDLITCDEAHRTTGAAFEGEEESHFVKVRAEDGTVTLCSMDDETLYDKMMHT